MAKQKFYVVWEGVTPGVYTSWTDCQLQIKGYEGANINLSTPAKKPNAHSQPHHTLI